MVPNCKSSTIFECKNCNYYTSRKSQYDRHLLTDKHCTLQNPTSKKFHTIKTYVCVCGKSYKHSSTFYSHKKNCGENNSNNNDNSSKLSTLDKDDLIITLLKQNAELLEIVKNGTHNTTNNTTNNNNHTNSHNKAFNLNFFLNETCKNAMNITDFVDSIKLQLSDFMEVGEAGFVQGISNIIVKKLNDLDETVRPIHCTDQKRETFYVKDENKWEKEEEDLKRIRKMINKIAFKNERLMLSYKEKYPDYDDPDSNRSDQYSKFVIEALGGQGDNDREKQNKIIKHITRATTIKNK
jgi:hypothetical protein